MLQRYLPILEWGRTYDREVLGQDLMAAVIVTIMLIPQSLAYAMLAGLPPVYWKAMLKGKEWMVDPEQTKNRTSGG